MPRPEVDAYTLERANSLIARGLTMQQVADTLKVSRISLYRYGFRSSRGYNRG